jgi:hypothetical protein
MSTSKLQEILDNVPSTPSCIECWDHTKSAGVTLYWSEKGRGFGEYAFYIDKIDGKFKIDNECDSRDTLKRVLDKLLEVNPDEIKKFLHMLVDCGELGS